MNLTDFYSDNGAMFVRLFRNKDDFPSIIKSAQLFIDRESMSDLPATSFAAPDERMFPIYDPASTLLSFAYAKAAEQEVPESIMGSIKTAAGLFGLENEILRLEGVIAERKRAEAAKRATQKKAELASDTNWSISVDVDEGRWHARAEGSDKRAFLTACNELTDIKVMKCVSIGGMKKIAQAIIDEGLRLGEDFYFDIPDDVLKLAGHGYPDPDLLQAYVSARSIALPIDKRADFVEKVARLRREAHPTIEGVAKLAELVDTFDRDNGLEKYWGDKFPDPLRSVHNISTREAARLTRKVAIGNTEYRVAFIDKDKAQKVAMHVLGREGFDAAFGEEFSFTKLAQILDSEHSEAFNRLMSVS